MENLPEKTDLVTSKCIADVPLRNHKTDFGADSSFVSPRVATESARLLDGLILAVTGIAIAYIYPDVDSTSLLTLYISVTLAITTAYTVILKLSGGYGLIKILHPLACISSALFWWAVLFGTATFIMFATKEFHLFSRVWLGSWFALGCFEIIIFRFAFTALAHHWNKNGQLNRRAVLVGGGEPAHHLYLALKASKDSDMNIIGIFDDRDDQRSPALIDTMPKLGNISQLIDYVRNARVDVILVTLPLVAEERLLQIVKRLWVLPVDIRLCAQNQKLRYQPRAYSYVGNIPFLDLFDKPLGEWEILLKNIEDKLIAVIALLFVSPFMLIIALMIKMDSKGPALFKQIRYGFNNELIHVYKFRTMFHAATDTHGEKLTVRNDPRVTRIGRFLRRSSLDELPQLFNVLGGTLSLVGPRPHATKAKAAEQLYTEVVDGYFARHKVKPGITGWAQINGWRGETDTIEKLQRRVEHDIYYIENWSLLFDLYILIKTPWALLKGENAH